MSVTTRETQLPAPQWDVVAYLGRYGRPANAAMVKVKVDGASHAVFMDLADRGVITAHRGDQELDLRMQTFLPTVTLQLTPLGVSVAAVVVQVAGLLLWLDRRGRTGAEVKTACAVAGMTATDLAALTCRRLIEAFRTDGDIRPVDLVDLAATRRTAGISVRVTALGREYTTDKS